jgi:DNA-binding NtrC family response regulator
MALLWKSMPVSDSPASETEETRDVAAGLETHRTAAGDPGGASRPERTLILGRSPRMRQIFGLIRRIAPTDVSVLIQGETGTGKELAARAIHDLSTRAGAPFVVIDCGAIPANLIESELFGHERGAFTDASYARAGAFERAEGGTIFLDELGELKLDLQPRLLRVLENREVRRVGSDRTTAVDVRVIAATNRELVKQVQAGRFREDLYFRLSVVDLHLPPLRERQDDLPHIIRAVLNDPETILLHGRKRLTRRALERLQAYAWPGNVRELMNVISHVLAFSEGEEIDTPQLPTRLQGPSSSAGMSFDEHLGLLGFKEAKEQVLAAFEREYIAGRLKRCQGNVSRVARESGMHRKSVERLAKKHHLNVRTLKRPTKV